MSAWAWASSSVRGTSHVVSQTRCQDAHLCRRFSLPNDDSLLLLVVADGAGSASYGGQGAWLACRSLQRSTECHLSEHATFPTEDVLRSWIDLARDQICSVATSRGIARRDFASTLICALVSNDGVLIAHIGDGSVVLRDSAGWRVASWPAHGEFVNTTSFLTDDPAPDVRITRDPTLISGAAIFTDGLERLILDFQTKTAHSPFFSSMIRAVDGASLAGRNPELCVKLAAYLNSDPINSRTDDDKTLVLAARR